MRGRILKAGPFPSGRRVRPFVWSMVLRSLTALVGGYAAAAVLATLIARLLPIARVEATSWGMILSFPIYASIALWCFHEHRLLRVTAAVWGVSTFGGGLLWLLGVRP
ncbi:hypothetical protein NHF48_016520 [Sphingomonas sp. H160509]|uniref:hypothetical protein n=1 Tax=Sphingomonas sp. H160509 TaxID=2955313 RepID=UPI0020985435|nr:hypothetical protein [Sphingomonas sp. H160509]MDD1452187.1 hypothetical protein [Sphingomonas sp. H160509]